MHELTSADILVLIQAVESLVEQSADLVASASPIAGIPSLSLPTGVQAVTLSTSVEGHPP